MADTWADSLVLMGEYEKRRDHIAIKAGIRGIEQLINFEHDALKGDIYEFARQGGERDEALRLLEAYAPTFVARLKESQGVQTEMFEQPQGTAPAQTAAEAAKKLLSSTTTMEGVPLDKIVEKFNEPWTADVLSDIPNDYYVKGKTPKAAAVAARVNQIFGMEGVGWRFAELPQTSVHYSEEEREVKKQFDEHGELISSEIQIWHVVRLEMFVFEYQTMTPAGRTEWIRCSPISDVHENLKRRSAYRGAMSSILKQVVIRMGGFKSIRSQADQPKQNQPAKPPAQPQQQPKPPEKPQEQPPVGLTETEVKQLADWGASNDFSVENIKTALGIQHRSEWTKGYVAAQDRILQWGEQQEEQAEGAGSVTIAG